MNSPCIVIFSDNTGWHEERLQGAMSRCGTESRVVSLRDCGFSVTGAGEPLQIPGFRDRLPDAAFVRAIPDGTFEEVTLRLDLLHALEASGVIVTNPARAIECTVDKAMTSFLLARSGVPTPHTWVCESAGEVRAVAVRELNAGRRLVLKPLFGNCGRGLVLVDAVNKLPPEETVEGVFYLQSFIGGAGGDCRDWRVFVIGRHAVAAMERINEHWITNRARGARCLEAVLTEDLRELAERATAAVRTHYAGVDIIRDATGAFQVLEVNSVPAWRGLQSVTDTDISQLLADDLVRRVLPHNRPSAVV